MAREVQRNLGIDDARQDFFSTPLVEWLKNNYESHESLLQPCIPWKFVFSQAVRLIWLHRNRFIFQTWRKEPNIHAQSIKKIAKFFALVPDCSNKLPRVQIQISWKKPRTGQVKLNTNGVVFRNLKKAGGGGVLRDSNGDQLAGFMRKLGSTSSILAELQALKDGLSVGRQLDILNINIDLDADVLVHLLTNPSSLNLMLEPPLNDCKNLIKAFHIYTVTHIFREANRCVDKLTNMGATQPTDFLLLY